MKGEDIIKRIITSPDVTPPAVTVDANSLGATLLVQESYSFFELWIHPRDEHTIDITCYGDRHNAFGAVNPVTNKTNWPNACRYLKE